jgi:UTP--glucose-1-phosphate uridylyltransferase
MCRTRDLIYPGVRAWFPLLQQGPTLQLDLDEDTQRLLGAYGFDAALFAQLREKLLAGELSLENNRIRGRVEPPAPGDIRSLPEQDSQERRELSELGLGALRANQVGCVVLAGGMATRFGGVVKAAVDALPGRSFLTLKLEDIRRVARRSGTRIPVYVMSSFATHDALLRLVAAEQSPEAPIEVFSQFISLRLEPDGALFREQGRPSPYAPGHGDLSFALRRSGVLGRFIEGGGKLLAMSNVDNLGATLDPAIVGAHLQARAEMSVELAARAKGEPGGAPACVDGGRLQIIEDFRFPLGFDHGLIPYFNTNTFVFNAAALDRDFPLTWFVVRKNVDGRQAIQFEHLAGELSAFVSCRCIEVARSGDDGRFQPVKDPDELDRRRPEIERVLRARGVI